MRRRTTRNTTNPKAAVAYLRTSTDDQQLGPAAQRTAIERWAAGQGVEVVAWHEDHVSGAALPSERPALTAALADLRVKGAGLLVAAKRDRIARDPVVARLIEREAESHGSRVVSVAGEGDGDTPEAVFQRGIADLVAELERGKIRQRTKDALQVKKSRGERVGSIPFGCRLADDGVHLVADEAEQEAISHVRTLRAAGMSLQAIADRLEADGIKARGVRWYAMTVGRILDREAA